MNPRAAINDLTAFQAIPFNHLGTSPNALSNVLLFVTSAATFSILPVLSAFVKCFFRICFILPFYAATNVILSDILSFVKYYFKYRNKT